VFFLLSGKDDALSCWLKNKPYFTDCSTFMSNKKRKIFTNVVCMNQAPADDVFINIEPGKNYTYTYRIDAQQSPGLYWYHPHLHGSTLFQVCFCFWDISGICLLCFEITFRTEAIFATRVNSLYLSLVFICPTSFTRKFSATIF